MARVVPHHKDPARELLAEVQRHLPAGTRFAQEAFTSERRRPVFVRLSELAPENFYLFDELAAHAFRRATVELAARDGSGRLTITYPSYGEFQAQRPWLQRGAFHRGRLRVLVAGQVPAVPAPGLAMDFCNITASLRARYSLVMNQGPHPRLFICRDGGPLKAVDRQRSLGFFSVDGRLIEEIADEIELLLRGGVTTLRTFERLETLHQTTQRISRELESYSRRMELAVRRAQRRPDLLTPARFDRIVGQAVAKMEQLQEIPRRALRTIEKAKSR
jgi:hypothetical protein